MNDSKSISDSHIYKKLLFILILVFCFQTVHSQTQTPMISDQSDFELPQVDEMWLRAAPPNANMLAAYAVITNNTAENFKLTGAYAPDFNMAEIHKTIEVDGMLKMREQKTLDINKNTRLMMKPGGLHVMLMMPKRQFTVGEDVRICLVYEDETGIEHVQHLDFPVLKK